MTGFLCGSGCPYLFVPRFSDFPVIPTFYHIRNRLVQADTGEPWTRRFLCVIRQPRYCRSDGTGANITGCLRLHSSPISTLERICVFVLLGRFQCTRAVPALALRLGTGGTLVLPLVQFLSDAVDCTGEGAVSGHTAFGAFREYCRAGVADECVAHSLNRPSVRKISSCCARSIACRIRTTSASVRHFTFSTSARSTS